MNVSFFVPGIPRPGGSKRPFLIRNKAGFPVMKNGHPIIVVTDASGKKGKDWRGDVRAAAQAVYKDLPVEKTPVHIRVEFYFPRPKSHFRTGKNAGVLRDDAPRNHLQDPDATKLLRSIEDALSGILWKDDNIIVEQLVTKGWNEQSGMTLEAWTNPGERVTVPTVSAVFTPPIRSQQRPKELTLEL